MADDKPYHDVVIKCPIPRRFFKTTGVGESDHQIHAGSYHMAMAEAGIQGANLMSYSSMLPPEAKEIGAKIGMKHIHHGSEMKIIQAVAHIDPEIRAKGITRATAAIRYAWLRPKADLEGPYQGGLVCEYGGHGSIVDAQVNLDFCMREIFRATNKDTGRSYEDDYVLEPEPLVATTFEPKQRFGTALAALAFIDYIIRVPKNASNKDLEAVLEALQTRGL